MNSASEVKEVWIQTVKDMIGVSEYYVSKKFDRYFRSAAELVRREGIDIRRFCEAQIQWAIDKNMVIYPSLLGGQALQRYRALPDDTLRISQLRHDLSEELKHFVDIAEKRGYTYALEDRYYGHSPILILYMYRQLQRDPPVEVVEQARQQMAGCPLYREVYPADFVKENFA